MELLYNPYKSPYIWVAGVTTILTGVKNTFTTGFWGHLVVECPWWVVELLESKPFWRVVHHDLSKTSLKPDQLTHFRATWMSQEVSTWLVNGLSPIYI